MAEAALTCSCNVPGILARCRRSIVALGAAVGNSAVVVTAVRQAIQEMNGIVAIIALLGRRDMELRFTYNQNTVVAFAAVSKDFLMIDREDRGKLKLRMTGLALITGGEVIRRFAGRYHTIVTGGTVIDDAGMVEDRADKADGVVAGDAILGCWNMRSRHTSGPARGVAAIVAGNAISTDSLVIEGAIREGRRGMADVAIQGGGNVTLRFTDRRHAMAGLAVVDDAGMIEPGSDEAAGPVADATVLVGLNVPERFALGEHAIVAGLAVINDPDVIEGCRHKARGDMAFTAVAVGRHVAAALAFGEVAVVAQGAVVHRASVIEMGAGEFSCVVAIGTILRRRNMHQRHAGGRDSVVTGCTVADYPRMIKHGRGKTAGDVAGAAIGGCRNMAQVLAGRRSPIVTRGAAVDDPAMIEDGAVEDSGVVADAAILGR